MGITHIWFVVGEDDVEQDLGGLAVPTVGVPLDCVTLTHQINKKC